VADDPLAPFRREQQPASPDQEQRSLTEHQALRLAIDALNEIPNSRVRMRDYATTYKLIPDLERTYQEGERRARLMELAPMILDTLDLCEDALTELGRTDDGTPSIQALINIQVIKKELSSPQQSGVVKESQLVAKVSHGVTSPSQGNAEREAEADREPER
jgi:hypothetical protein